MEKYIKLGNHEIGPGRLPFVVAEIGINHNGDLSITKNLIDEVVLAGCGAIKFQKRTIPIVYSPEELVKPRLVDKNLLKKAVERGVLSKDATKRLVDSDFDNSTNGDLKWALEFTKAEYKEIDKYCRKKGIIWFASPWDEKSVDFLEQFKPPCYKIASACNGDKKLLSHIKSKKRPMIVSVGMTDDSRIDRIVKFLGEKNLVVLHCTATYPAKDNELHLANIPRLIKKYPRAYIGYSGHETGVFSSLVAGALGACVIERHVTLDRSMWGSDQAASLEMLGLNKLVKELRSLNNDYMGKAVKEILDSEKPVELKLRRVSTLFGDKDKFEKKGRLL